METHIGNKPFKQVIHFKNADTVDIPPGVPIIFLADGSNDGFSATLPSTGPQNGETYGFFAGINSSSLPVKSGETGTALIWGFYNSASVLLQTRAATTDAFSSSASIGLGVPLYVQNDNNALGQNKASEDLPIVARLAQSVAALEGVASNATNTSLIYTQGLKVIIRGL